MYSNKSQLDYDPNLVATCEGWMEDIFYDTFIEDNVDNEK